MQLALDVAKDSPSGIGRNYVVDVAGRGSIQ